MSEDPTAETQSNDLPANELPAVQPTADGAEAAPPHEETSLAEAAPGEQEAAEQEADAGESAPKNEHAERAAQWGYVDDEGNIHLKPSTTQEDRVVGKVRSNAQAALAFFAQRFDKMTERLVALETEVAGASSKGHLLRRVEAMLQWAPGAQALGDFDDLLARLRKLEEECSHEVAAFVARREELCAKVEELVDSTEWKATSERIKALQEEWKAAGFVPKDIGDALWNRFRGACNRFFDRRQEHFGQLDQERSTALEKKLALCEKVEAVADSTEWKAAAETIKGLQAEWKAIGPVPKDQAEAIWARFRGACDRFFDRRATHFNQLDSERGDNQAKKEALIAQAEALADSTDWKETSDAFKRLQEEWKKTGPAPKAVADQLWARFRGACDRFFERRPAAGPGPGGGGGGGGRRAKDGLDEVLTRKREQLDRMRESIAHDESNIKRWTGALASAHAPGQSLELRTTLEGKIKDVTARLDTKRARLAELEASIGDISGRVR